MGLGGAFVALADDATAAFANPAGLVQLLRPEVSLELRRRKYSTPFTAGGRAEGAPTGWGIDTFDGIRTEHSNDTTSGVSFLSFVYPATKWSLALFRHQLADFSMTTDINGLFGDVSEGGIRRHPDQSATTDLDIVGTGLSGAYRLSDQISLGFGLTYFSGRVEYQGAIYSVDVYPDTFWESNSFLPHRKIASTSFTTDDTDVGFNIGVLWKLAESWHFGAVYRKGPQFDYELYNRAGPLNEEPEGSVLESVTDRSIAFPNVWGLGVAYRSPDGDLTVGFEWDRVEYTAILESLDSPLADLDDVSVEDANELHLGVEYVFLEAKPLIAVRGGLWHDPDHRFRSQADDPFARALYPKGENTLHVTMGIGVAFKHFQIDIGADFSEAVNQFAVSAIYSF
jgi:long-subunit fatty acid transport protein